MSKAKAGGANRFGFDKLSRRYTLVGIGWQMSRALWQVSFPFVDWLMQMAHRRADNIRRVSGDVVVDEHRLLLPSDLEPGNYEVYVGAYLLETGERLPVFDEVGNEMPGANVLLMELVIE